MCGGAIISEFIPHRGAKRGLCAEDIWPHAAADFDDLLHAHAHAHGHDDDDFAAAASFHPDQGTHVRLLSVNSTNDDDQPCTQRS
jgi:EREBP-like factor